MAEVFMVVVSYNNHQLTQRAVDSLRRQSMPTDFVVWDNASTDGTQQWLMQNPDIPSICSSENVLWTPAINKSIKQRWNGQRIIGWMNNDAAPMTRTVERVVALLDSDPKIGIAGPSIAAVGGQQDIVNCDGYQILRSGGFVEDGLRHVPAKRVSYILGAFALLRKEVWDEIGPLDEAMPLGADDHDYCMRLKDKGYQIWVAQNAFCQHSGHASASESGKKIWNEWESKSWDWFNEKHAGRYPDEETAIKSHWDGRYFAGYDR